MVDVLVEKTSISTERPNISNVSKAFILSRHFALDTLLTYNMYELFF